MFDCGHCGPCEDALSERDRALSFEDYESGETYPREEEKQKKRRNGRSSGLDLPNPPRSSKKEGKSGSKRRSTYK